jgi:hypothetical protein
MTLVRPRRGNSAAETVVVQLSASATHGRHGGLLPAGVALLGILASLAITSSASALIISGPPAYSLPGGGSCSVSGFAIQTGGATVTCTGLNLAAHTKVYFGIRNDTNVNGNTMTNANPGASSVSVFRYASETGSSITYTSTTTIDDALNGSGIAVNSQLILTRTGGTATVVSTGGTPASNGFGDIQSLFQITGGTSFTVRVDVKADNTFHANGQAGPAVYDPTHTAFNGGDRNKVDLAFYFSDCGDGTVDSPEQCDLAGANGATTSCCTSSCTFRNGGEICRPGPGAPCDTAETCTGAAGNCPPDDAPINNGNVCRMGSGDICDQNETCTGVPGQNCPPDDAPGNTTIVCRASTTGDICDEDELCTGVPGQTCPADDAPGKLNFPCRPGSGDICDPTERCTGIPGQACPPDVVANPTVVCRAGSGDSCDPAEHCTAIPTQLCPANVVTPGGTVCRAAAGTCDVAEQCSGTPNQACPANAFVAATTPCNQDGNVCTVDQCNGSGSCAFVAPLNCDDTNLCTQDSCDAINGCEYDGSPSTTCVPASKAVFKYKNKPGGDSDGVRFVWSGGPVLVQDMGDPTQTTRYELCVYDGSGFQMAMGVPPGAPWESVGSPASPKGYKYKDKSSAVAGIKLIKTKASSLDKAKLKLAGKGDALPDTAVLPFVFPVTAQLYASDGDCWDAQFDQAETRKNEEGGFTGKTP